MGYTGVIFHADWYLRDRKECKGGGGVHVERVLTTGNVNYGILGRTVSETDVHGITEEELKEQSTFSGFDFDKVWKMGEQGPELRGVPA